MSSSPNPGESPTLSQRVLFALKETRSKLEAYERARSEPIAIIGMGCRFPGGADDPDLFWDLLCRGVDAIREVPADRWDAAAYYDPDPGTPGKTCIRSGGFLRQVDLFDAEFFGISPREARSMDPQQRLLLEVAWEAFENAGQGRESLFGNRVGVFIGIGNVDYARLMHDSARTESIDLYSTTGNVFSAAAGRLSYTLGLHGPCVALDTACSSSLVAIHLACQSLRADESVMALAGGVNLILSPQTMIAMSRVPGGLSPDGRCKTFDASANGLGRGEGCGLVVLKRLSDAIRDRDNIVSLIRGSAVNQDGRSAGLTVPNGQAQVSLIEQALASSRVTPDEVSYVETHGPGTALGDPIEVGALGMVFGQSPRRERPLIVGSVKTNIGHLESAAGVAGLIKTALTLQHGEIPANLHFRTPNPHIPWNELPITVPTERSAFAPGVRNRIAGVSAFGVAGTNAHAILEEPPQEARSLEVAAAVPDVSNHLLTLSAKNEVALLDLVNRYRTQLERQPQLPLADVCYTASVGRFHFHHRLAILADSAGGMREQIEGSRSAQLPRGIFRGESSAPPRTGFFFPDIDAVQANLGREHYSVCSAFRNAWDECDRLLQEARVSEPKYSCSASYSFGYALAQMWRSWGITPSVVMGRGIGEVTAACVAGILRIEDALELRLTLGKLRDSDNPPGDIEAELERIFSHITCSKPRIPVISQVTAQRITDEMASSRYWMRSFEMTPHAPRDFSAEEKIDFLVDVGTQSSMEVSLETLAKLYAAGAAINWESFYRDRPCRRVPLATYPFQRKQYWFEKKEAQKATEPAASDPLANQFYEEEWRPAAAGSAVPGPSASGTWLILAKTQIGSQAAAQLEQSGNTCIMVLPGECYEESGDQTVRLDASSPGDFDRLFARLSEKRLPPVRGIIHLWSINSSAPEPRSLPELNQALREECGSLLHLIQAVINARFESPPKVWVVTEGAVQVDAKEIPRISQFPIWGMTGVLEHEHPELGCTRIDLDPSAGVSGVAQLLSEIGLSTDERRIAYRGQRRFVARLSRCRQISTAGHSPVAFRADATYLISGGLGGLGRLLADWMVAKGAKHIVLVSRRAPRPEAIAHFNELQKSGATVTSVSADVSDPKAVEDVLSQIDGAAPLRGIFHCAGALDDGIFINQTWEKFEKVLRPKVDGAWNLHHLTATSDMDFLVLFSSGASVFGNPGQANYATANAFLDGLARFRRASGMAGLSINWGIWSGVGGVAERQLNTIINAAGIGTITPEGGLKALERLHSQASPQVAVMPIHWPEFLKRVENWRFVEDFREASSGKTEKATAFIETLKKGPARERRSLLVNHIRSHVDQVLGTRTGGASNSRLGFFEMGMDSLTAVELKNRLQTSLGCKLSSTVAFECPTIEALVDHLAKEELASLFVPDRSVSAEPLSVDGSADAARPVDQLSEEEVNRLMDERLNSIETLLER
jgi:acyl transferase domain-containing protein/acyl carrier protein